VKALTGVAELPAEDRVGLIRERPGPVQERIRGRGIGAVARRVFSPSEAERRREVAVVEEVFQDVGPWRTPVVPFNQRAINQRLDDDVALAVEGRDVRRQ
jgi:hypothetical protein